MLRRHVIVGGVACVLVLLALLGNLTNKVRIERESHESTRKELLVEKKRIKIHTRIVKIPMLLPNGVASFRTDTTILSETEIDKLLEIDEKEKSDKEVIEKPALKKWQVMAAQCVIGCQGQLFGGGYRQSLWIIEPAVWTMWNKDLGLVGATIAF